MTPMQEWVLANFPKHIFYRIPRKTASDYYNWQLQKLLLATITVVATITNISITINCYLVFVHKEVNLLRLGLVEC